MAKIVEIVETEKKIPDHDEYIATNEFDKLTKENFADLGNLASKFSRQK